MSLPLDGIRVLDAATVLAAPLTAALLGEFGAEVIKVEDPKHGDPIRGYPPFVDGESAQWPYLGKNKKSVTIDLHNSDGVAVFRRLVAETDLVVTNFRPPTLRGFGIDFDELCKVNPELVLVHISAYGRTGPYADRPGFARVAEAFAGLTGRTGNPDGPPMFSGYAIADGLAGIYGAYAAMLALRQRDQTGTAQLVDLALYEPVLRMMEDFIADYGSTGEIAARAGNENPKISPNGLYPTKDGKYLVLPASTQRMWERLVPLLDDPDLAELVTFEQRITQRALVDARVAAFTSRHDLAELVDKLTTAGVACGPVNDAADICADEHIQARGSIREVVDPERGRTHLMQAPAGRFSGFAPRSITPGPRLGADTDAVLGELAGCTATELARLRASGAI
ncbi:formyl-CoA transferase [Tamaricihabitans halophyticus]|uniref:Formyl-CoA transferase n=1 Tax=Tamaricihabitans halophyticus TaxID=1262583 RepID=A0A4R2R3T2_9PSEU|nr:CoA transferase [Tamaricihabitans halophyticus]TCP57502.1 formyl-CoA transferase [Tamaricihabitans halophyticus]